MTASDTWVVVPMFNEASVIHDVVAELRSTFANVVCIDDGSRDECAKQAYAAGATVLRHPINLGQGAALQTGFDYVAARPGARYLVTFDGDGQHRVADAVSMVEVARANDLDVVLASRFTGQATDIPRSRRLLLRAAVRFTRWTTRIDVTDAHNGLRVLNTRTLDRLRLRQRGMAHASELLGQVGSLDLSYAEVPVTIVYNPYSRAKSQANINSVNILFDLATARLRTPS